MDESSSSAYRADKMLRSCFAELDVESVQELNWMHYDRLIDAVEKSNAQIGWPEAQSFEYEHPLHLQDSEFGVGKPYAVRLSYSDAGGSGEPVIAIGGLTNVKQRFDFLALDAKPELRLYALDLAGRGCSGWLAELTDYSLDAYVDQLKQFMNHLGIDCCTILGSSLGAAAAIRFAAEMPQSVVSLIINDSGPYIPAKRRRRRATAVARHYKFGSPAEMFRRTGAAAKHAGPASDAALLRNAHCKTRWSDEEQGRVYRHDLRAMLAYRAESRQSLDLWHEWSKLRCPVLLVHGMLSDATSNDTIARMLDTCDDLSVIHVEQAGHTPSLSFLQLTRKIVCWRNDRGTFERHQTFAVADQPRRFLFPNA